MNNCMHCTEPGCTLGKQHLAQPVKPAKVKHPEDKRSYANVWIILAVLAILAAPFTVPLLMWSVTAVFWTLAAIALACTIGPGLLLLFVKHL